MIILKLLVYHNVEVSWFTSPVREPENTLRDHVQSKTSSASVFKRWKFSSQLHGLSGIDVPWEGYTQEIEVDDSSFLIQQGDA